MSQMLEGGGSTLIRTLSEIFPFFFSDASPNYNYMVDIVVNKFVDLFYKFFLVLCHDGQ